MKPHSRLIMLEGLPDAGKSTNARIIMAKLEQTGKRVRWIHEVARPHPTLFFNEAVLTLEEYNELIEAYPDINKILEPILMVRKNTIGIDLLEVEWQYQEQIGLAAFEKLKQFDAWNLPLHRYIEVALEKWQCFAEYMKEEHDLVVLLDSSIFQFQIYTFLLKNMPYDRLEEFIQQLFHIISDLDPSLIYLYRQNVDRAISHIENTRGVDFFERIWQRDRHQPYYENRPRGAEGYKEFLRDYHKTVSNLFAITPFKKLGIEISEENWQQYVSNLSTFLGLEEKGVDRQGHFPVGQYRNEELDINLVVHEGSIIDPYGKEKKIFIRGENEFYVDDIPVVLHYVQPDKIIVKGEQLIDRWTMTGTEYIKSKI